MNIDLSTLSNTNIYHVMTQTIIPRPIAWVLSENSNASMNLAPFSYFNAVCSDPPLCMLSMGKKPDGAAKDTATNLVVGAYCVIHIAHLEQAGTVTATAATLEYGESEIDHSRVSLVEHANWPLKRISDCPIAYLCKVHSTREIGNTPQQLVFAQALELYVDDSAISQQNERFYIDALAVNPLARLGANQYASIGDVISKSRPK